ncbi:MAG: hypothetical protein ACYC3W_09845 [Candidatus Nanopelagicales bacterium]
MSFNAKVHFEQGGGQLTAESGGKIVIKSGGSLTVAGVTVDGNTLAMTGLTATANELNLNDNLPASFTLTPAAGAATVSNVTIQAKDAAGVNMARAIMFLCYLSDAATGIGLTGTTASGTVTAAAASGTDFGQITAKKAFFAQTKADGSFVLEITDAAKTGFYVCAAALQGGAPSVSAQLVAGNYGV